jgi:hypothetical protein
VQPSQRIHQPRRIEFERGAVGTVLRDLIAVDPLGERLSAGFSSSTISSRRAMRQSGHMVFSLSTTSVVSPKCSPAVSVSAPSLLPPLIDRCA